MPNRTRTVASAIVCASVIATSVSFASFGTAHAVDECLSAPKGSAPAGAHWYYRSDRETKRKCWYVADIPKSQKVAPQQSAASSPKPPDTKLPPATANARAELLTTPTPLEQPAVADPPPQPKPEQQAAAAPDQMPRDLLVAAFRAHEQPDADRAGDHNVMIADDSVNVDPGLDAQAEPPPRAVAVQMAAAPAAAETAAAETATAPLPAALGWILIGLGLLIFGGGLAIKLSSAVRFERSNAVRA